ncbi:hypothetical protein EC973_005182 [Apophysomyces ossiformis]|uniref:Kinase n=1 Tax=Apophysomyces ossiformis TaxID=679940 RepID=A0A8H7BW08_9FUNG|nr:hypothetical protein EC973_005182 [Apophysomyces ossiformis]
MTTRANLVKFDHQVAGHDQLLQLPTNDLIVVKPCTQTELVFYEQCRQYPGFEQFIPECYGSLRAATESEKHILEMDITNNNQVSQNDVTPVPLEIQKEWKNIIHGFTRPSILDLKIGDKLYDEFADEVKKEKMILNAKGTTIETLALRISGMKVYDPATKSYKIYNKRYGRMRTETDIIDALLAFLFPTSSYGQQSTPDTILEDEERLSLEDSPQRIPAKKMSWILESFIQDLEDIQEFVTTHPALELTGVSILFVYEGDTAAANKVWKHMLEEDKMELATEPEKEDEEEAPPKMCDLRLIDFAHSRWKPTKTKQDQGILNGINNMIGLLKQCLRQQQLEKL